MNNEENLEKQPTPVESSKPKRTRVKAKPMTSSPKPTVPEQDQKIIDLANGGFNVNQIGSMLGIHTHYIKDLLAKK